MRAGDRVGAGPARAQHANVETFITFRSSTPLVLSWMDYLLLGRSLPSPSSWACLAGMLLSCLGYALLDSSFSVHVSAGAAPGGGGVRACHAPAAQPSRCEAAVHSPHALSTHPRMRDRPQAYSWMAVWYAMSTFDAVWFKTVCNTVHLSNWNRVLWWGARSTPRVTRMPESATRAARQLRVSRCLLSVP